MLYYYLVHALLLRDDSLFHCRKTLQNKINAWITNKEYSGRKKEVQKRKWYFYSHFVLHIKL